jgi:hypothetical protein
VAEGEPMIRLATVAVTALAVGGAAGATAPAVIDSGGCTTVPLAVVVDLDNVRHANLIRHEHDALTHEPRVLHIDRADAAAHRAASLAGIPTRTGFDRDEYPPAMSAEGGAGADVAYVPSSENRSGGSVMSHQLASFCDGQAFIVEP